MEPPINEHRICANACLNRSKPLMSAQQPFVAPFSCFESWHVQMLHMESVDRDGDSCEVYICMRKGITTHSRLRKEVYQVQDTKSAALTGSLFLRKRASH